MKVGDGFKGVRVDWRGEEKRGDWGVRVEEVGVEVVGGGGIE